MTLAKATKQFYVKREKVRGCLEILEDAGLKK
jgi:hypothetical protein